MLYYNLGHDTVGVVPGDGFYDLGSPRHGEIISARSTLKVDLTNFFTEKNKFKTGLEARYQEMQMVDIFRPWVKPLGFDNRGVQHPCVPGRVLRPGQYYAERHDAELRVAPGILGPREVCGRCCRGTHPVH